MKTELLAEKTALVMQNKNGGFRDLYGSLSTVQCFKHKSVGFHAGLIQLYCESCREIWLTPLRKCGWSAELRGAVSTVLWVSVVLRPTMGIIKYTASVIRQLLNHVQRLLIILIVNIRAKFTLYTFVETAAY